MCDNSADMITEMGESWVKCHGVSCATTGPTRVSEPDAARAWNTRGPQPLVPVDDAMVELAILAHHAERIKLLSARGSSHNCGGFAYGSDERQCMRAAVLAVFKHEVKNEDSR